MHGALLRWAVAGITGGHLVKLLNWPVQLRNLLLKNCVAEEWAGIRRPTSAENLEAVWWVLKPTRSENLTGKKNRETWWTDNKSPVRLRR